MDRLSSPSVTKAVILKAVQVHGITEEDRALVENHIEAILKKENLEKSFCWKTLVAFNWKRCFSVFAIEPSVIRVVEKTSRKEIPRPGN